MNYGGLQIGGRILTNLRYANDNHPVGHFGGRTAGVGCCSIAVSTTKRQKHDRLPSFRLRVFLTCSG